MKCSYMLALVASLFVGVVNAADAVTEAWAKTVQQAAFVKNGMERLRNPQYQYECLGLGGTVMRVGADGFSLPGEGVTNTGGWLKHLPYLSYQYWWDEKAHRHHPFDLLGGYGQKAEPGQIVSFRHNLDIASGFLEMDLSLKAGLAEAAFKSHRELFVTPEGVLVIRIIDAPVATAPFQMSVGMNDKVRI